MQPGYGKIGKPLWNADFFGGLFDEFRGAVRLY
jgi:hypothetical protein